MGQNSKIEWTDHTFNPWRGCAKVSAGCENCYAERMSRRNQTLLGEWGQDGRRAMASANYWALPKRWNRAAAEMPFACRNCGTRYFCGSGASLRCGRPCEIVPRRPKVFCGSLCDVFELRPDLEGPRMRLLRLIVDTPNLDWLLLTKRPENYCEAMRLGYQDGLPPNLWLGVSVENQEAADVRIPLLLKCPARVRFLSCEPLLGPLDLAFAIPSADGFVATDEGPWHVDDGAPHVHWVIAGGESGPNARPSHPDWFRSLRDQCDDAGVPFFFKQWGEWANLEAAGLTCSPDKLHRTESHLYSDNPYFDNDAIVLHRFGKASAGHLLDGREHREFPKGEGQS